MAQLGTNSDTKPKPPPTTRHLTSRPPSRTYILGLPHPGPLIAHLRYTSHHSSTCTLGLSQHCLVSSYSQPSSRRPTLPHRRNVFCVDPTHHKLLRCVRSSRVSDFGRGRPQIPHHECPFPTWTERLHMLRMCIAVGDGHQGYHVLFRRCVLFLQLTWSPWTLSSSFASSSLPKKTRAPCHQPITTPQDSIPTWAIDTNSLLQPYIGSQVFCCR